MSGFGDILKEIVLEELRRRGSGAPGIDLMMDVQHNRPRVETGVLCGKLMAWLAAECLEGAPADGARLRITFRHTGGGALMLVVRGQPARHRCAGGPGASESPGAAELDAILGRLRATIEVSRGNGTEYRVRFEEPG